MISTYYFGTFGRYVPELSSDDPRLLHRVLFLRNEFSEDWYEGVRNLSTGLYVATREDIVVSVSEDPTLLFPDGCAVYGVFGYVGEPSALMGQRLQVGGDSSEFLPPEDPVPPSVTPAQAKLALFNAGLLAAVEGMVATHPYPPVRIYFENASEWTRNNPYVLALGQELGLDSAAMDNLFRAAARL